MIDILLCRFYIDFLLNYRIHIQASIVMHINWNLDGKNSHLHMINIHWMLVQNMKCNFRDKANIYFMKHHLEFFLFKIRLQNKIQQGISKRIIRFTESIYILFCKFSRYLYRQYHKLRSCYQYKLHTFD